MADDDIIKAGTVILRDLELFNKAVVFFETKIDPTICNAVYSLIKDWAEQNEWATDSSDTKEYLTEMEVWPIDWQLEKDTWIAWFKLAYRDTDEGESYEIANFFNAGQTGFGFRLEPAYDLFSKASWKKFTQTNITNQIDQLTKSGWLYEGKGIFFRPLPLVTDGLVSAWENEDWSQVLAPLTETLNSMKADKEVFDSIFDKLKQIYKPEG